MRVYIVIKYNWMEFAGIEFVTANRAEAEQYCKQKNKTSRECEYSFKMTETIIHTLIGWVIGFATCLIIKRGGR